MTHTRQESEHNAGLTMNKETRYQSPHKKNQVDYSLRNQDRVMKS